MISYFPFKWIFAIFVFHLTERNLIMKEYVFRQINRFRYWYDLDTDEITIERNMKLYEGFDTSVSVVQVVMFNNFNINIKSLRQINH